MKRTHAVLVLGTLVIMGAILAACGGSGTEHSNNTNQVTTPAAVSGSENTVKVQGQTFNPGSVSTKAGQSVVFDGAGSSASESLVRAATAPASPRLRDLRR